MSDINCVGQELLGKAEIVELKNYEKEDDYFPHDCSMESDMLDKTIEIEKNGKKLTIKNIANDGFTGHSIKFELNSQLEIKKVDYEEWTDVLGRSSMNYTIEKSCIQTEL